MATYRIYAKKNEPPLVTVRVPRRMEVVIHRPDAALPIGDRFRFRGSDLECVALTVLTHYHKASPHAVLRGKTPAWKEHRRFFHEFVEPWFDAGTPAFTITTEEIRKWHRGLARPVGQAELFSQEDQCQHVA